MRGRGDDYLHRSRGGIVTTEVEIDVAVSQGMLAVTLSNLGEARKS